MRRIAVDETYATVGAREDIDGYGLKVVLCPSRQTDIEDQVELFMTPQVARAVARRLNRWAKLASS